MNFSEKEMSVICSDDLIRIKENVRGYFISRTREYSKQLTLYQYLQKIELGLNHAGRYGLNTEYSLIKYVDLMFNFSSKFDSSNRIKRILADEQESARIKIDKVYNILN